MVVYSILLVQQHWNFDARTQFSIDARQGQVDKTSEETLMKLYCGRSTGCEDTLCAITAILKVMRWVIGSQCNDFRKRDACVSFGTCDTTRAREFWTLWNLDKFFFDEPYRSSSSQELSWENKRKEPCYIRKRIDRGLWLTVTDSGIGLM